MVVRGGGVGAGCFHLVMLTHEYIPPFLPSFMLTH